MKKSNPLGKKWLAVAMLGLAFAGAAAADVVIGQVAPYPYMANLPVIREYQDLLKKYAPGEHINYTSFEEFLGAKARRIASVRATSRSR